MRLLASLLLSIAVLASAEREGQIWGNIDSQLQALDVERVRQLLTERAPLAVGKASKSSSGSKRRDNSRTGSSSGRGSSNSRHASGGSSSMHAGGGGGSMHASGAELLASAQLHWPAPSECPSWIEEYAAWHKPALGDERTRFMLHECIGEDRIAGCPGIGDRLRALSETFKLSVFAKRAFLARWEDNAPLEAVFQPSLIDWQVKPKYMVDDPRTPKQRFHWHMKAPQVPEAILNGSFASMDEKVLLVTHPDQDCKRRLPGPDIGCPQRMPPTLRACVFHALFKPSDALAAAVAELRRQMFGSETEPYVAVHMRLGGFQGERKTVKMGLSFGNRSIDEVVANTLRAAKALSDASGFKGPVLVLTDNDQLRTKLQDGKLPGFVSPPYKAKHGGFVRGEQHKEALVTSFQDIALLAGARCFIASSSGFSITAFMWGRHTCYLMVNGDGNGGVAQRIPRGGKGPR